MPFEDFYKAADQYAHRWRMCLIAAILFIAVYSLAPFFFSWLFTRTTPTPPPMVEPVVSEAARRDADSLCMDLPKPEQFSLASVEDKKTSDGAATVVYTYTSGRGFDEIMPRFLIWFEREGWVRVVDEVSAHAETPDRGHSFGNANRRVSVLFFDRKKNNHTLELARFEIVCTIEKTRVRD